MKIITIFNSRFARLINVSAVTLYPFIFFADNKDTAIAQHIVSHEYIHVLQIRAIGWWKFYATYFWQYVRARFSGKNHNDAYNSIDYEIVAYAFENTTEVPKDFV